MEVARAVAEYRRTGQKITPQRLTVMRVLEGNRSHPTAAAVVERVRETLPSVSAATVYRVLDELVEMGELALLDVGNDRMRFDPNTGAHAHLVCRGCGAVEDVEWTLPPGALPDDLRRGYVVTDARVVFTGNCPRCRSESRG